MIKEKFELPIGNKTLKIEITDWALQASGSCLVSYGDTVVMANATMSQKNVDGFDFFPLTIDYEEKFYAAGKILGSRFLKRESRPSDEAILTSRMIDRAVRPLFPKDFKKEIQIIATCVSFDGENDPDIISMIAASFALAISNIPWNGPLAAVKIGKVNGKFVLNPTYKQRDESQFELTLSAIEHDGEILINMIEMGAREVSEEQVMEAYEFAKTALAQIINFQKEVAAKAGNKKAEFNPAVETGIGQDITEFLGDKLDKSITDAKAGEKNLAAAEALRDELVKYIKEKYPNEGKEKQVLPFFEKEMERIIIRNIIEKNQRPDG